MATGSDMEDDTEFVFRLGAHHAQRTVRPGTVFHAFTEDTFSGRLTSTSGRPRETAPYPWVNPLAGPIAVEGVKTGDILAVRLVALKPARDWGVSTISPNFGLLSGTRSNPNLQPEQEERVWIWRFSEDGRELTTETVCGKRIGAVFKSFLGTIGVAPAHGEVRLSVTPGDFGGNLDLPDLGPGVTIYLRANVDGGHLYLGDGHYVQGDGEIAGTAVEGALNSALIAERLPPDPGFDWPRIETDTHIGVVGCARPLEDAVRIAASGLIHWVGELAGLDNADSHQFVSQNCQLRIGNLVNPAFSVCCSVRKILFEARSPVMGSAHRRLSMIA